MSSHPSTRIYLHPRRYQTVRIIFIFCEHNKFSCLDFLFFLPFGGCLICFKTKGRPRSNVFPPPLFILNSLCVPEKEDRPPRGSPSRGRWTQGSHAGCGGRAQGTRSVPRRARPWARTECAGLVEEDCPGRPSPGFVTMRVPAPLGIHKGPMLLTSPGSPCTRAQRASRGREREQPGPA